MANQYMSTIDETYGTHLQILNSLMLCIRGAALPIGVCQQRTVSSNDFIYCSNDSVLNDQNLINSSLQIKRVAMTGGVGAKILTL